MILDLLVLGALAVAAYSGWRAGFIGPALAEIGVIAVLVFASRSAAVGGAGTVGILAALVLATAVGSVAGRVSAPLARAVRRVAALRAADPYLGVALSGLLMFVTLYVGLLGLVALDDALTPLHRANALGPAQVASLRARLASSPALGALAEPSGLDALEGAARAAPVPVAELDRYLPIVGAYELKVRPQLTHSALAGPILAVGERAPVIGQPAASPVYVARDATPN